MFCPRPFVDEGCQVPAAPATELSLMPAWIFSGEKQLSHSSLQSVPTSPAARDAREFTEDRRLHGEPAGFGLLVCKPLRAGRNHLPGLGSVGSAPAGKGWRDCRMAGYRPAFQLGRAASGCSCSTGGKHQELMGIPWERQEWHFRARRGVLFRLWGRSRSKVAAGREGAEPTAPAPRHQQPLCPSSQVLLVKAGGLQPGQGPQGSLFLCLGHSPLCGRLGPCHTLLRAATHDPGVAQGLEQHQWLLGAALLGESTHTPLEVRPGGCNGPWHPPSGPSCQPGSMAPWLHLLAI